MGRTRTVGTLAGIGLALAGLASLPVAPAATAAAGDGVPGSGVARGGVDRAWAVLRTDPDGTATWPRATERAGWPDRGWDQRAWSFRHWSYPRYPLNCGADADGAPAYQFIWAMRQDDTHASLLDSRGARVRSLVRRASSVFAASWGHVIDSAAAKLTDHTPRVVTVRTAPGRCAVAFDRVRVPPEVWRREPYQNYDDDGDPATPPVRGLFAWLQAQGYDSPDRRYVVLEQGRGGWEAGGGFSILAANGIFRPLDDQPGPQNRNEAAGTWILVDVRQDGANLDPASTGNVGEVLAHEWAHSLGAVLPSAPHYNTRSGYGSHPADCADLLCYNSWNAPGQHYDACGGAAEDTFRSFITDARDPTWGTDAPDVSRAAYRLDCHRDDYWGIDRATGLEKPWTRVRWSTSSSRWLWGNPDLYAGPDFDMGSHDVPPACVYDPTVPCPDGPGAMPPTGAAVAPGSVDPRLLGWRAPRAPT